MIRDPYREPRPLPVPRARRRYLAVWPERSLRGPLALVVVTTTAGLVYAMGVAGLVVLLPLGVLAYASGLGKRRIWK